MSYRLALQHQWPSQPNDVVAAVDSLKTNITTYKGSKDNIFLVGHSSGCTLVSIIGADASYLARSGYTQKDIAGIIAIGCCLNSTREVTEEEPSDYETYTVPPEYVDQYMERERVYTSIEQLNNAVPENHIDARLPKFLALVAESERFPRPFSEMELNSFEEPWLPVLKLIFKFCITERTWVQ